MSDKSARLDKRLRNCFELALPQVKSDALATANVDTVEGWDSVATLMLISAVEEEFSISIGFDRVEELTSFVALHNYLVRKLIT